jgi:signal transduction protein with GAF and PtsI domain
VSDERDPATEAALAALVSVGRRLAAADRLWPRRSEPLLEAVAATAAGIMDAQAASIALHDPATDRLVFVAAAGPAGGDVVGLAIESTAGIAGYAFATGQPLAVADVAQDPRFDRTIAESTGYVPRSLLATPLVDEQGALGVLEVLDRRSGTFDLHDLEIAATLARGATVIARHGRAERDATRLLRASLVSVSEADASPAEVDRLVAAASEALAEDGDDPVWQLADRIARLVASDPDRLELAVDWLDALVRRADRGRGGRVGTG